MSALLLVLFLSATEPVTASPVAEGPRPPYRLVLLDGSSLMLRETPRWAFGRASVIGASGRRITLQWKQVDHEATRKANPAPPPAPGRTWTEKDLARLRGERLNVTGAPSYPDEPAGQDGQTTTRPKKRPAGEAAWRARAEPLRTEIAQLEAQLESLERAKDQWEAFTLGTGDYQRQAAHELGNIRRARKAAEARLKQARGRWSRLEEEARTTNTPPGWLR